MEHAHALTHLAVVLAAAFIGGAIFNKLKQPVLVSYILVGLVLGPGVLGIVQGQSEVSLMAELGILLLLFIAGMELDLKHFKSVSRVAVITCAAQIGFGLLAMGILGLVFDWPLNRCILLGFAVSLSSTAVALKILEDTKQRTTRVGQVSLGILIAQDIAVIPMILIMGALQSGEGINYTGIIRLVLAVAIMIGVIALLYKRPSSFDWIWKKFEYYKSRAMKGQTAITALAFCFTASALAGLCGLSAAYGAFLAGIVLGQTVNQEKLEKHTRPIFDVMIMVFFLSIGLLIDLKFLADNFLATVFLLILTMVLKTVLNVVILRAVGMKKDEAYTTGAVLAQVGEFSFILAAIGLSAGTIGDAGYKYVVAIISLSLLATPLWLYLVKRRDLLPDIPITPMNFTKKYFKKRYKTDV